MAEHSFRARSCLRNSARAQILHKNKHGTNRTIILFAQFPRYLYYFCFTNEYNVLMVLLFYYNLRYVRKGHWTMQRTQQLLAFVCYRKNPVKCSACVVSRKKLRLSEKLTSRRYVFLENRSLEFYEIWHKNTLGDKWLEDWKKKNFNKGNSRYAREPSTRDK